MPPYETPSGQALCLIHGVSVLLFDVRPVLLILQWTESRCLAPTY
jgi:hypothetical protein